MTVETELQALTSREGFSFTRQCLLVLLMAERCLNLVYLCLKVLVGTYLIIVLLNLTHLAKAKVVDLSTETVHFQAIFSTSSVQELIEHALSMVEQEEGVQLTPKLMDSNIMLHLLITTV